MKSDIEEYRNERKFQITEMPYHEVEEIVRSHPALFQEIFHQRFINNIYFDKFNSQYYFDAIDGLTDRVKVRIRWYGEMLGNILEPVLELKYKSGALVKKVSFPLISFEINKNLSSNYLKKILLDSEIPDSLKQGISTLDIKLINRYSRKYFLSKNGHFRITIDTQMQFFSISKNFNHFNHSYLDRNNVVLELKYSPHQESFAQNITQKFPFRMTKNSKYVFGIDALTF